MRRGSLLSMVSVYPQDQHAGNIGDLLKHWWLLRLVERVATSRYHSTLRYLESHAGAGSYPCDHESAVRIAIEQRLVRESEEDWTLFNQLNPDTQNGTYYGSWILAFRCLRNLVPWDSVLATLWERHRVALHRIRNIFSSEEFRDRTQAIDLRPRSATVVDVIDVLRSDQDSMSAAIWLCDPYWGQWTTQQDLQWWKLLVEHPATYGIVFGCTPIQDREEFKRICAPRAPDQCVCDDKRAYGLWFTERAFQMLGGLSTARDATRTS